MQLIILHKTVFNQFFPIQNGLCNSWRNKCVRGEKFITVHFTRIYSPTKIYTRILNNIFTVASNLTREPTTRVWVQISNADIFNSSDLQIYILTCSLMLNMGYNLVMSNNLVVVQTLGLVYFKETKS